MTSEPPPLSGRGGDQPDIELKELIAAQQDLGEDFTDLAGWQVPEVHPPAILRIRAVDFKEQMLGLRARYWMTSYDDKSGELLAIGWKDGLRVVSEVVDLRDRDDRIAEPGVWLQDEADWYRTLAGKQGLPRFLAGVSRTWVDVFVSSQVSPISSEDADGNRQLRWLAQLLVPPAAERVALVRPARDVPSLVGRRVLCVDEECFAERDLRAISDPMLKAGGDVVVAVVDEADWYLWTGHSNNARHSSMGMIPIGFLWAEP